MFVFFEKKTSKKFGVKGICNIFAAPIKGELCLFDWK